MQTFAGVGNGGAASVVDTDDILAQIAQSMGASLDETRPSTMRRCSNCGHCITLQVVNCVSSLNDKIGAGSSHQQTFECSDINSYSEISPQPPFCRL